MTRTYDRMISNIRWQFYTLWFDNVVFLRPYAIGTVDNSDLRMYYDWNMDDGHISLYWDNELLHVDTPLVPLAKDLKYHQAELLQWEALPPLVRSTLNHYSWKTNPGADELDRECPFSDHEFVRKLNASYVAPRPRSN